MALSPAGSVVVYLNSSTAAPAGATQDIKLRLTRGGRSHIWLRTAMPFEGIPLRAEEPLLAIMRRLG